jgi:transglutaminase-like putative cysteine protease
MEAARAKGKKAPEESLLLRTFIGLAVMVSVAGVVAQDAVSPVLGVIVLVTVPLGFWVAYKRRDVNQVGLKFAAAGLLLLAFANFLRHVSGAQSIDDARAPLAELFLWVQALHSFDQPRRTDLSFSLASSAALIALGGSLSVNATFLVFFVPWGVLALGSLALSHLSEVRERHGSQAKAVAAKPKLRLEWRGALAPVALVLVGSCVVFLFAPRGRGMQLQSLPFEVKNFLPLPEGSSGIVNSGLPASDEPGADPAQPAKDAYFGFANFVDLRTRGHPSDELVMRVRASQPAFWRGPVFDTYRNSSWTASDKSTEKLRGFPVDVPGEVDVPSGRSVELVQTFYVEKAQSNVVFAAYRPREVWFPGGIVESTKERALRAGFILDEGVVYSVVSDLPVFNRDDLEATFEIPEHIRLRYTQLPPDLPPRVADLAKKITANETTIVGAAEAIEGWLKDNAKYTLDIPRQPSGTDAVDHFLFTERRGFCEQFASSLAVMLRTLGVPTRFATGYDPGDRNVFSGYWEVRAAQAHSWVQVYFPKVGWVDFDPTADVPSAEPSPQKTVPGIALLRKGAAAIGKIIPDNLGPAVGKTLVATLRGVVARGPVVAIGLVVLAGVGVVGRIFGARLARRLRVRRLREAVKAPPDEFASKVFWLIDRAGADASIKRDPATTPSEYAVVLTTSLVEVDSDRLTELISAVEAGLYGGRSPTPEEAERLAADAIEIGDTLVASAKARQLTSVKTNGGSANGGHQHARAPRSLDRVLGRRRA